MNVMNAQYRPLPYARLNAFHGPKRQLLGNHAGHAAPAWRVAAPPTGAQIVAGVQLAKGKQVAQEQGSKIFLSRLPADVAEKEVEELFKKTIGPLKESFLIYNSQGKSKGMAVVAFQRPGDAAIARAKYDGKIVDGRRPIKIEIVVDSISSNIPGVPSPPPSLFDRLGGVKPPIASITVTSARPGPALHHVTPPKKHRQHNPHAKLALPAPPAPAPVPPRRIRQKKGPRRIKKQVAKSREQLDKEMEDYRAAADTFGL